MSCPSLKTIFIVLVTSVAANHEGALCDCASQGPWQPLFKPSQILHSEFPEHQHSSSTGGPKPTKFRTIKIVPHLVVPLVNPLAIAIHHDNRHGSKGNHLYDEDRQHDHHQNTLDESHHVKEKPVKEVHYHYSYPYEKDPYPTDSYTKDPYDDTKYNETPSNTQTGPGADDDDRAVLDGGGNNDHNHLDTYNNHYENDQNTHYNHDTSSENANVGSNEAPHNEAPSGLGTTGSGPTGVGPTGTSNYDENSQENYNPEEGSTAFPYYSSGEQKDHMYDSSKFAPAYKVKDHATYNDIRDDPYYYNHHYYNQNNIKNNDLTATGYSRGKSLRYPTMIDGGKYADEKYVRNSVSGIPRYKIIGKSKGSSGKSQKANPAIPQSLHSDLYHPPPPPPPSPHSPPSTSPPSTLRLSPNRAPIYHHPPFAAILSPWKVLVREEAKRMTILRPPAPGLADTWTSDLSTQRSNDFPIMKKPRVLYVMKTIPK